MTVFKKVALETALRRYGEDAVADAIASGLTPEQVRGIGTRHQLTYMRDPSTASGAAYAFDKALALAAVEVLEGRPRELARKRRRSDNRLA